MRRLSFSSLRVRLILLVLIAALPAMGLILYTDMEEHNRARAHISAEALLVAQQISNNHERLVEGTRLLLAALAQLPDVRSGDSARCSAFFHELVKQYPFYTNLAAARPDGEVFCSGVPATQPTNFADREWFSRVLASRKFTMSQYLIGRIVGKPIVAFSLPVLDDEGLVKSVVFAGLSLSWINQLSAKAQLPPGSAVMVVDRKGTILARDPEQEKWVGKSAGKAPIIRTVLTRQQEGTVEELGTDGILRLWAFTPLSDKPEIGAYVCVGIPSAVAFAETHRSLLRNLALLALVVLLALLAARRFGELLILQPVNELLSVSRKLAEGDLTARVGPHYPNGEVGQLALAFDQMAESLQRREAERKEAEEARRRSEARFGRLAENAPDLIYRYEFKPRRAFTYINPAATAITGYTLDEYYADPDLRYNIIHSEDRHLFETVTSGGFPPGQTLTLRWVRKDGTMIWIELRRVPVYDDDGNLIAVEGIGRDITENKRAEEALQQREKYFRALIENGSDIISELDTQASIRYVTPSVERALGYKQHEVTGKSVFDFIHPDDVARVRDTFSAGIANPDHTYSIEIRLRHRDGSWRMLEAAGKFVTNPEGFTGVIVNCRDVTERRRAEEKIANLNRTLRAIRDINQMIVHEKDPQKLILRTSEILVEHRAYHAVLLILTDETGKPHTHAVAGMKEVLEPMVGHLRKGAVPPCCEAERLHDGVFCVADHSDVCAPCPITSNYDRGDVICIRLQHDERIYGYLAGSVAHAMRVDPKEHALFIEMAGDVAFALHNIEQGKAMQKMHEERDRFEAELRQAQKMEAIGALAGGIAHDFNNVLTAIIGYTQLAEQDAERGSLLHRNLQEVLKAGNRAKDLVKQILTFSRQAVQELVPVQVKLVAKEALKMLRPSLPPTIEIRQHIQNDSTVWSDPTQIHQVVMNLYANAAHAMRVKGGILEVSLRDVALDRRSVAQHPDSKEGQYVVLEVADTGHGIDPSNKDRIFDPFFTTKEQGEGTGMGLAVVHGIVKKLGGFISVYSEVGKGSNFKIYMPSMSQEKKPEPEGGALPIPKGKERILFVDDEPALVEMGKQVLERLGYLVTGRTSSIEALALFQARPNDFDVLITDMTMPKMTGEELAKKILSLRKELPVILCTGFSARLTEERAKEIGVGAIVMKPLVVADLAGTIRQCLDQKK